MLDNIVIYDRNTTYIFLRACVCVRCVCVRLLAQRNKPTSQLNDHIFKYMHCTSAKLLIVRVCYSLIKAAVTCMGPDIYVYAEKPKYHKYFG